MRNPNIGRVIGTENGRPPRRRLRLWGVGLAAAALILIIPGLFNPWIFFTGGHWHLLPEWQGWGRFTANGAEYALFVRMMPRASGPPYLSKSLGGDAFLCMPEGTRLHLGLRGRMAKHLPLDVRGQAIYLEVYQRSLWAPWGDGGYQQAGRPALQLKGIWGDRALDATGLLRRQGNTPPGVAKEKTAVTVRFEESGDFVLWPQCPSR